MGKVLQQIGYDIAYIVKIEGRPQVNLFEKSIDVKCLSRTFSPLIDFIVFQMRRSLHCMFFVTDNMTYLETYINSLAVFMANSELVKETIREVTSKYDLEKPENYSDFYTKEMFWNSAFEGSDKRLYLIDARKLVQLANSDLDWDEIFSELIKEVRDDNVFLLVHNMHILFDKKLTEYHYAGRHFFFATHGRPKLPFISVITWDNYVNHIENGQMTGLIRHRRPIYFSSRPRHFERHHSWIYDDDYVYHNDAHNETL